MLESHWPLDNGLPHDLPWQGSVALLLDGVSVEKLPQHLHQWAQSPVFEALYAGTRWAELGDISPCLVLIDSPNHPILTQFLHAARQELGYLVFCEQSWEHLVAHFRWLTSVLHPQGEEVLLRIADPAVIHALLAPAHSIKDPTLFGPCTQIVAADAVLGRWHINQRPGLAAEPAHAQRYRLSDEQLTRLDSVNFRALVMRLDTHLQEHFPAFQADLDPSQRWGYLNDLALSAYTRGFCSGYDIVLFANIHGFLGVGALHEHPDLDAQLNMPSIRTTTQRLEQVANIAKDRAEHLQRNPA